MTQIFAVDPSLHSSGWCWLRDGKVVEVGVIKVSKGGERGLAKLKGEIASLFAKLQLDGCPVPFDVLALQSSHLTPKMRRDTGIILGQVAGIWLASVPFVELRFCTPGEWGRCFHLPKGRFDRKERMLELAMQADPEREWTTDSADAYGVAKWAEVTP